MLVRLSKGLSVSRAGHPDGYRRSDDGQSAHDEGSLVVPAPIEQVTSQEGADGPPDSAATVGEAENGPKIPAREKVRRNRVSRAMRIPKPSPATV